MDNPKIRIESDGITAEIYLDGEKISCTALDFHGDVKNGLQIKWHGTMHKREENGNICVENNEIVMDEFYYDSREARSESEVLRMDGD